MRYIVKYLTNILAVQFENIARYNLDSNSKLGSDYSKINEGMTPSQVFNGGHNFELVINFFQKYCFNID